MEPALTETMDLPRLSCLWIFGKQIEVGSSRLGNDKMRCIVEIVLVTWRPGKKTPLIRGHAWQCMMRVRWVVSLSVWFDEMKLYSLFNFHGLANLCSQRLLTAAMRQRLLTAAKLTPSWYPQYNFQLCAEWPLLVKMEADSIVTFKRKSIWKKITCRSTEVWWEQD